MAQHIFHDYWTIQTTIRAVSQFLQCFVIGLDADVQSDIRTIKH